jgi:hypothetical protein
MTKALIQISNAYGWCFRKKNQNSSPLKKPLFLLLTLDLGKNSNAQLHHVDLMEGSGIWMNVWSQGPRESA